MIIRNNIIPFKGYKCINLCGVLFVRGDAPMDDVDLRHERIHTKQCLELLIIGFYLIYVLEWFVRYCINGNSHTAYRNISFEREAYAHEREENYKRKPYQMWR